MSISVMLYELSPNALLLVSVVLLIAMIGAVHTMMLQSQSLHQQQLAAVQLNSCPLLSTVMVR